MMLAILCHLHVVWLFIWLYVSSCIQITTMKKKLVSYLYTFGLYRRWNKHHIVRSILNTLICHKCIQWSWKVLSRISEKVVLEEFLSFRTLNLTVMLYAFYYSYNINYNTILKRNERKLKLLVSQNEGQC